MEYPGSVLTKKYRRVIFWLFVAAFLIIAPVLSFYTSGYRYDFKNGIIRKIGAISIDIYPKDTVAYLNGIKLKNKIPIRLKNIAPQKYKIRLTAEGYYDWEKEVEVENKQTQYIKEISLLRRSAPALIEGGNIKDVSISPNGDKLIFSKITDAKEYWIMNLADSTKTLLEKYKQDSDVKIIWAKKYDYVILDSKEPYEILVINTESAEKKWRLDKEEKSRVEQLQWNETWRPEIFYSTKNQMLVIDANTKQKYTIGKKNFIDWYVENGQVWTMIYDAELATANIVKDAFGFKNDFASLQAPKTEEGMKFKILSVSDDNVLIKKTDSNLAMITKNKTHYFYGDDFLWSPYNNWLVVWTPWEITTYSKNEDPYLLSRSGGQLKKVVVLDEYNTLGLVWPDKITALFPYYFVSHDLANSKINDAVSDNKNKILYYSTELNGKNGLWKLEY